MLKNIKILIFGNEKYGYKSFLTILSKNYIKKSETVSDFYGYLGMRFLADSEAHSCHKRQTGAKVQIFTALTRLE